MNEEINFYFFDTYAIIEIIKTAIVLNGQNKYVELVKNVTTI